MLSPKLLLVAAVFGLCITAAHANPNPSKSTLDPSWSQVPTLAEVNAVWPKQAIGMASGRATLRCALDKAGALGRCKVISETPSGWGFGNAALILSKSFRATVNPTDDATLGKYKVDVPFRFTAPATADSRVLTKPRWISSLTANGMAQAYPQAAIKAGVLSGQGTARCKVTAKGELTDCQAVSESPAGLDFGAAAVKAASAMRMNPWTREGDTVDGMVVTLPVQFTWDSTPGAGKTAGRR